MDLHGNYIALSEPAAKSIELHTSQLVSRLWLKGIMSAEEWSVHLDDLQ